MRPPRLLGAAVCAAVILSGCSASTQEPTVGPASTGVVPVEYRTPEPTPPADAEPTPSTVMGVGGRELRYVPSDPSLSLACRPLTEREREQANNTLSGGRVQSGRPARAVDLPESGFAVVAFWGTDENGKAQPWAFVTGGGHMSDLYDPWPGSHTLAGVAFADGPQALAAARECVGA